MAGQVEAALHLARMHFAHAEALLALERVRPDLVLSFRQAWAEDLARAERLGEALAVGWPARESIPEYEDWMKQALEREDLAACQALALAASDDTLTGRFDIAQRLNDWFADSDLMTLQRRRAVLELLTQTPVRSSHPALRKWANRTARAVMRSASSPFALGDSKVLRGLAALSGDPWLQEDAVYSLPRFSGRLDRWEHTIERRGQLRIYDTGVLADGRTLVALGQAGLIVLSARGAVAQSFAEPVYGLVRPLEGETYLTVSPGRTGTFRENRHSPSIPTALDGFAENHDGFHWVVWRDLSLYQIDLKALFSDGRWQALQQRTAICDDCGRLLMVDVQAQAWLGKFFL